MRQAFYHIIQKQTFEIEVPGQQEGILLQQLLAQSTREYLSSDINALLEEIAGQDQLVVVDRLEVNMGNVAHLATAADWSKAIVAVLQQSLQKQQLLYQQQPGLFQNGTALGWKVMGIATHAIEVYLYYLKHGRLMPDAVFNSVEAAQQAVWELSGNDKKQWLEAVRISRLPPAAFQRLAALPMNVLLSFVQLMAPGITIETWNKLLNAAGNFQRQLTGTNPRNNKLVGQLRSIGPAAFLLQELFVLAGKSAAISVDMLMQKLRERLAGNLPPGQVTNSNEQTRMQQPAQAEQFAAGDGQDQLQAPGIFVSNAGLCLLTPFLPQLFKVLTLVDATGFIDSDKQQRAIFLLHYLATGELFAPEEQLVLAKLFCGWPLQLPCFTAQTLQAIEAAECRQLLEAVIGHWTALKNTSVDGLRQGFLQRPGKLIVEDERSVLIVEQQPVDVLMEAVPWAFRMVALPWMKQRMEVTWF